MTDKEQTKKPWILWLNYGYEGWKPYGFDSLKEALEGEKYAQEWVITPSAADYEVSPTQLPTNKS